MNRFAALYATLDGTTSTKAKIAAIVAYLASAPAADLAWGLFFLSGRRFKRLVGGRELMAWLEQACGLPTWLIEDSLAVVGDFAETAALLMDARERSEDLAEAAARTALSEVSLADWVETKIEPLRQLDESARRAAVVEWWRLLPRDQVFLLGKLLTGELRVGVSTTLVVRAVAQHAGLTTATATARMMGEWRPSPEFVAQLFAGEGESGADDLARPYPFFLASPIEGDPAEQLGESSDWQVEWKWDGIRGQLIRRGETIAIWSRGEERIEQRFPELVEAAAELPSGLVLDGEVLAWDLAEDRPLPFAALQRRLNRKQVGKKLLAEVPVAFVVFDVIEHAGEDLRERPLAERRVVLEAICTAAPERIRASPTLAAASWSELAALRAGARERHVEGMMLKRRDSTYGHGRRKGPWWKWKIDPLTVDAVLVYAQAGSGRRANMFTDYTFAVWNAGEGDAARELVTIAKAYSGLTDDELREVDKWIRTHTLERFGPVRQVEPIHVFELAFEGIARSTRHKSGVAVRFPRILRWRKDKLAAQADTLAGLQALIDPAAPAEPE